MSWITSTLWRLIAFIASKPSVALWIIQRDERYGVRWYEGCVGVDP